MTTRTQQRAKEAAQREEARAAMVKLLNRVTELNKAYAIYADTCENIGAADKLAEAVRLFLEGD